MIRRLAPLVLFAALALWPGPAPAQSFDEEGLIQCALHKAIAAITCKPYGEFFYLGKREGIYVFTGYWAMHYTEFYAQVMDHGLALFSSPDWGRRRVSAKLDIDYVHGCVEVRVQRSPCNSISDTKCCPKDIAPKAP